MSASSAAKRRSRERLKVRKRCGCNWVNRTRRDVDLSIARAIPAGPVGRLVRRLGAGQHHHPRCDFAYQRRLAGLVGLVAQQPLDPRFTGRNRRQLRALRRAYNHGAVLHISTIS